MTVIDAHNHVWDLARSRHDWLDSSGFAPIRRSFSFDEARDVLRGSGVDATVLVQSADDPDDTRFLREVAASQAEVVGVVGYVPFDRPEEAARQLEALVANPMVVGIRTLIHDRADPDWLLRPEADEGLGMLERAERIEAAAVSPLPPIPSHVPSKENT